jgi:hypothetical protein
MGFCLLILSIAARMRYRGSMQESVMDNPLAFDSSSPETNNAFTWARRQALAYAFLGDPVGPWYEAALPGREAFCMRDVSHQAMGAHALGLAECTKNMLRRFAENATEPRDWCSLWEIDRFGDPPRADYLDDDAFWFCLPANFDLLDCCLRMYEWTGDRDYLRDPVFLEFYGRTVHDHVERWDLDAARIMRRRRILNGRGDPGIAARLKEPRGIPGYNEGDRSYAVGMDLLAALHAGYRAYAFIQDLRGNGEEAAAFRERAAEVRRLTDESWWDPREASYRDITDAAGTPIHVDRGGNQYALYWRLTDDGMRLRAMAERMAREAPDAPTDAVEGQSHLPEILYRCGQDRAAFQQILLLSRCPRREYPEVSFSVVGAVTTGLMGIDLEPVPPAGALRSGMYVDRILTTFPRLPDADGWARMDGVRVRGNVVSVRHDGSARTTLINVAGPSLIWRPRFPGSWRSVTADGIEQKARVGEHPVTGAPVTTAELVVGAGESITAEAR